MKKTVQFLFALCILFPGQKSFAGVNPEAANVDKPTVSAPLANMTRTTMYLAIIVYDEYSKPVSGASVYAPCTGQKPILTDATGIAQFTINGQCNCDGAQAEITTSTCDNFISLKCDIVNQAFCKD